MKAIDEEMPGAWSSPANPGFLGLLLANLICITGSSSFIMLPIYMEQNGLTRWQIGLSEALFWLASVTIQPWLGPKLDSCGRRVFFLAGAVCMSTAAWGYCWLPATAPTIWTLRILQGIGFAIYVSSTWTWLADRVPPTKVGHYFGLFGLTGMLGGLMGCGISEWILGNRGAPSIFSVAGILAFLGFLILLNLGEGAGQVKGQLATARGDRLSWVSFWKEGLSQKAGRILGSAAFAFGLGVGCIFAFTATYLHSLGVSGISRIFTLIFLVSGAARLIAGGLVNRWGPHYLLAPCLASMSLGCELMAALPQTNQKVACFLVSGSLTGIGYGAIYPALNAIAVRTYPSQARGRAISLTKSCIDLGSMAGSLAAGLIAGRYGYPAMFAIVGGLIGLAGAFFQSNPES